LASRAFAMGSLGSRSLLRKPSIHQLAWLSPGCCLAMNQTFLASSSLALPLMVTSSISAPSRVWPIVLTVALAEEATTVAIKSMCCSWE